MPKANFLRKKKKKGGTADFKRPKAKAESRAYSQDPLDPPVFRDGVHLYRQPPSGQSLFHQVTQLRTDGVYRRETTGTEPAVLKVGKKAPLSASHTDTSFKSKRVKVSAQSILHDLGNANAITARGQGVQELLIQLRHYSPSTKRDALIGLNAIVDRHRGFVETNFGRLAEASLELVVCSDGDVRTALLAFQKALLASASARIFSPFANLYMAYVVSAMTSLDGGVRRDSISLLALLLDRFPSDVAERAERLAPNYAALLSVEPGTKRQAGREAALRSLGSLFGAVSLRYGGEDGTGSFPGIDNAPACVMRDGSGPVCLLWKRGSWRNGALVLCPSSASAASKLGSNPCDGAGSAGTDLRLRTLLATLPRMLEKLREVWMEAIATNPSDVGVMQSVVDVLLAIIAAFPSSVGGAVVGGNVPGGSRRVDHTTFLPLWRVEKGHRTIGKGEDLVCADLLAWFAQFVPLILEAFPLRPQEGELLLEGAVEIQRLQAIERLNMGLCELVVAAYAGPAANSPAGGVGVGVEVGDGGDASDWLSPVLAHVHEVLRGGAGKTGPLGPPIPSVLRVLSAATRNHGGKVAAKGSVGWTARRQELLASFGNFFESLSPRSEAKLLCVRFVCHVTKTLLSSSATNNSATSGKAAANNPEVAREVRRWLQSLPELLCIWEAEFPASSAASIRSLVEVAKLAPVPSPLSPGDEKEKKAKDKPPVTIAAGGAWVFESLNLLRSIKPAVLEEFFTGRGFPCLQVSAQMDAISLLYHLPSIPACVVSALASVCSEPDALRDDVRSFVLEVMHHRRRSLSPSAYLGFLVSILTGVHPSRHLGGAKRAFAKERAGGGKRQRQGLAACGGRIAQREKKEKATTTPSMVSTLWQTVFWRDEVTGVVCNSLAMMGTRGALLEALRPTLLKLLCRGDGRGKKGRGRRACAQGGGGCRDGAAEDGGLKLDHSQVDSKNLESLHHDGESLASILQRQRAAMACLLCCWDGIDFHPSTTLEASAAADDAPAAAIIADMIEPNTNSPLSPLKGPMAAACVQVMKVAGTEEAQEQARGARLLRPVLVLVKRWPSLLPSMLSLIIDASSEITSGDAACTKGESPSVSGENIEPGRFRTVECLLRCLQAFVRDPSLQGCVRRYHLGELHQTTKALCGSLLGSPLQDLVVQLRADVDLLGGGGVY